MGKEVDDDDEGLGCDEFRGGLAARSVGARRKTHARRGGAERRKSHHAAAGSKVTDESRAPQKLPSTQNREVYE